MNVLISQHNLVCDCIYYNLQSSSCDLVLSLYRGNRWCTSYLLRNTRLLISITTRQGGPTRLRCCFITADWWIQSTHYRKQSFSRHCCFESRQGAEQKRPRTARVGTDTNTPDWLWWVRNLQRLEHFQLASPFAPSVNRRAGQALLNSPPPPLHSIWVPSFPVGREFIAAQPSFSYLTVLTDKVQLLVVPCVDESGKNPLRLFSHLLIPTVPLHVGTNEDLWCV